MQAHGFIQGKADPCLLYVKKVEGGVIYLITYVDDFVIASKKEEQIFLVAEVLGSKFQLTNLEKLSHYLGIKIEQDSEGIFKISQPQYIDKMLISGGLQDAKTSKIPLDPGYLKLREDEEPVENTYICIDISSENCST